MIRDNFYILAVTIKGNGCNSLKRRNFLLKVRHVIGSSAEVKLRHDLLLTAAGVKHGVQQGENVPTGKNLDFYMIFNMFSRKKVCH